MEEELQKIYDSEINVRIESFWDGDWRVAIMVGDKWIYSEDYDICELGEVISALQDLIKKHLPNSAYAKSLKSKQSLPLPL